MPVGWGFRAGAWIGAAVWLAVPRWRRRALENLERAYGVEYGAPALRRIGLESFRRVGANLGSAARLSQMNAGEVARVVDVVIPESVQRRRVERREGWVAAISHLGNWELYGQLAAVVPDYPIGAVYQPLANAGIDADIRAAREKKGCRMFDRRTEMVAAANFVRGGGALGVLVDQYAGAEGVWVPFFGRLASFSPFAGTLAEKLGCAVVPVSVTTVGVARWRLEVEEPIEAMGRPVEDITVEIAARLEAKVRAAPEDWLWAHARWKSPRPGFLLAGRRVIATGLREPFRILVRVPEDFMAALAAVPAIRAVAMGRPDAHVTVVCGAATVGMWEGVAARVVLGVRSGERFDAELDWRMRGERDGAWYWDRAIEAGAGR